MSTLEGAARLVELPADAVPTGGITIVGYIDVDGEHAFMTRVHGDDTYSATIGLMAMASHHLMHAANPTPCEED